jgi:hypothetical protein
MRVGEVLLATPHSHAKQDPAHTLVTGRAAWCAVRVGGCCLVACARGRLGAGGARGRTLPLSPEQQPI